MLQNLRFLGLRAELPSKLNNVNTILRHSSSNVKSDLDVKIPKRIERNPTDILKALEQTIQRDPTAFHYKYPDDPYFAPYTVHDKRLLALSLESGRKSAQWIVNNNPKFFKEKISEPFIQAFTPKIVYNENLDVTEDTLVKLIEEKNVTDAIKVYHLISEKNIDISNDTKQLLLELVCFYNFDDGEKHEQGLEEKWFQSTPKKLLNTWRGDGFAESLFQTMDPDDPVACSTIIQGRLKFNEVDRGFELFDAAGQKGMELSIGAYNEVIAHVFRINDVGKKRWEFIEMLLNDLESKSIQPDLYTLNAILESLHLLRSWHMSFELALKSVKEFLKLGISPSLGSYYYLTVIYRNTNFNDRVLVERFLEGILSTLIEKKLEIQHPSDMLFFERMMDMCVFLKNWCLACLLNNLLEANDNMKFIGSNMSLNKYYMNYFTLLFEVVPPQSAMKTFRSLVPVVYSPHLAVFQRIMNTLLRKNEYKSLNEIWKDVIEQRADHNDVLENLLETFATDEEQKIGDEGCRFFSTVLTTILERLKITDDKNKLKIQLSGKLASNMMIGFVKIGDFDEASSLFKKVKDGLFSVTLNFTALKFYFEFCVSLKKFPELLDCLRYASMINYPDLSAMVAAALVHSSKMNDSDVKWLNSLANEQGTK